MFMTSQSVMVRFVCLRAAGSTVGGNCSRCTGRVRVGVEVCVVCPVTDVDTQHETPRHDRACRATTPRSMIDRAHVKRHTNTQHSTALHAHVVVAHHLRTRRTAETPP